MNLHRFVRGRQKNNTATTIREPVDPDTVPWLIAAAASTVLPHYWSLPLWLPITATALMLWRGWTWKQGLPFGSNWLPPVLAIAGTAGILFQYRTIFGQEAGVALLVVLMTLKLLELRSKRDAVVVVMLGYFLLLTHYFSAESIAVGLWMLTATVITTATLIRLEVPHAGSAADTLKLAGTLIAQATPIMAILFLLFPRVSGPLWGLPQKPQITTTGLSDEMSPGSISELSLSHELAFRAEFREAPPARHLLYWRGPVLNDFDGRTWKINRSALGSPPKVTSPPLNGQPNHDPSSRPAVDYTITLEPHHRRWLPALDVPTRHPANTFVTPALSVINRTPVNTRQRYEFTSATNYRFGQDEPSVALNSALQLPRSGNLKSRELAAGWSQRSSAPRQVIAAALTYFRQERFVYTLKPPLLGQDAIDQFLFTSKRGFCEHYVSSFVFLMRAAGIPARVVTGYLGGELNPIDGHLAVRQSDAHAWAEVWITNEGWLRIDPTSSVAPARLEEGLQQSLPDGEALPTRLDQSLDWLRALRYRWDAVDYAWNRWVLGYDVIRQQQLLESFGIRNWKTLISILAGFMGVSLAVLTLWVTRSRHSSDRVQALWLLACDSLAKRGFPRMPHEGPLSYALRISDKAPELGRQVAPLVNHYIRLRYTIADHDRAARGKEFKALLHETGKLAPRWKLWSLYRWNSSKT